MIQISNPKANNSAVRIEFEGDRALKEQTPVDVLPGSSVVITVDPAYCWWLPGTAVDVAAPPDQRRVTDE